MSQESIQKTNEFLAIANQFKLGALPTETRHPLTKNLSTLTKTNIPEALGILKSIELGVLDQVSKKMPEIEKLRTAIDETIQKGNKVYIYGCGATGRLALSLEYLWRFTKTGASRDAVVGFMSGGDLALIHSIESFEDHPEWGARQVREIGFTAGDLLIACTEGGETPSVIGAAEEATKISRNPTWFLYCNPDESLQTVERSARILSNSEIKKVNLFVGPMSLSGSTRLQATTALMLAAGMALFPEASIQAHKNWISSNELNFLEPFAITESDAYASDELLLYVTNHYGITIMTDTTERSPTFSLAGFENTKSEHQTPALCYVMLPETKSVMEAWERLLLRKPRTLEWSELGAVAGMDRLQGFDFSAPTESRRLGFKKKQIRFAIQRIGNEMHWELEKHKVKLPLGDLHPLTEHLILKFLLNAHSTIVMGRLNRFESNVMTWVKPSNNKLIDRAIRYVDYLLSQRTNTSLPYETIATALFAEIEELKNGEAIVLKTLDRLLQQKH